MPSWHLLRANLVSWWGRRGAARPAVEVSRVLLRGVCIFCLRGWQFWCPGPVPVGVRLSGRRAMVWMRSVHRNEASQPFGSLFRQVSSFLRGVGSGSTKPCGGRLLPAVRFACAGCAEEQRGTCLAELWSRRIIMHAKHVPFLYWLRGQALPQPPCPARSCVLRASACGRASALCL